MARCGALVVLALTLNAAPLLAQNSVFTVTVRSANVHKGPALDSPVIGHAARTTVLSVMRNLGSWAEIRWPYSRNGVAYVHVTTGRLGPAAAQRPAATTSPRVAPSHPAARQPVSAPAPVRPPAPVAPQTAQRTLPGDRVPSNGSLGGSRGRHTVGVGGVMGSMSSWGATARWWRDKHLGMQAAVIRDAMTSDIAPGRVTSMEIEPGVVYALFDRLPASTWIHPYVGSALSFRRQTLKDPLAQPMSQSGVGYRVFGGTEVTFAGVTQFSLSAELGYRRQPAPFVGFEPERFGVAIAGHWYIK